MVYCRNDNKTKQKELSGSRALQFVVIDLLATFVLVATVFYGDIILPLETAYNCQSVSYKFVYSIHQRRGQVCWEDCQQPCY